MGTIELKKKFRALWVEEKKENLCVALLCVQLEICPKMNS
jgi:hypothetical protein